MSENGRQRVGKATMTSIIDAVRRRAIERGVGGGSGFLVFAFTDNPDTQDCEIEMAGYRVSHDVIAELGARALEAVEAAAVKRTTEPV
jgi:hypothetical protein